MAQRIHMSPKLVCKLIQELQDGPSSFDDLAEATGIPTYLVHKWVREWRWLGLIHIAGWAQDTRGWWRVPLFCWGEKKDVPVPAQTSSQRNRTYRRKLRDQRIRNALVHTEKDNYEQCQTR